MGRTSPPPRFPRLAAAEVHAWCAPLDVPGETAARLRATLSPDEQARSARLRFERDRRRFIVARGVLRGLLGAYLQTDPGRIRFAYNAFGKPELAPGFDTRLTFNLSHSAGVALIAVASATRVGVDVERIRAGRDCVEIARQFFSAAEADALASLPSHLQAEAFFRSWTKKEAYLKACGAGLARPLNSVPARRWSFHALRPAPGYVGALAIEGHDWDLRQWEWTERGYARGGEARPMVGSGCPEMEHGGRRSICLRKPSQ